MNRLRNNKKIKVLLILTCFLIIIGIIIAVINYKNQSSKKKLINHILSTEKYTAKE